MTQYIDKSTLVAEIESKFQKYWKKREESDAKRDGFGMYWEGVLNCLNEVKTLINTLEVKEVGLKKENLTCKDIRTIDKYEEHYKAVLSRFKTQKGG